MIHNFHFNEIVQNQESEKCLKIESGHFVILIKQSNRCKSTRREGKTCQSQMCGANFRRKSFQPLEHYV